MKKIAAIGGPFCSLVLTLVLLCPVTISQVSAVTPPLPTTISVGETPPPAVAPNIIITSIAGSALPDYIELYNQSNEPINLHTWSANFVVQDSAATPGCTDITATIPLPSAWILSKKYVTLQHTNTPDPSSSSVPFYFDSTELLSGCLAPQLAAINIKIDDAVEQTVSIPATEWSATTTTVAQHKQRGNSPNSTRAISGVFDTDYKIVTGAISLNSDPLYMPPADAAGLQILEVVPNAKSCSPLDNDLTCNDYIKLYNPTDQPINLGLYRLRSGTKGQSESVTNTFTWNKEIDPLNDELLLLPHTYFMLTVRNDGQPLSITDGGGYIWLEDAYSTTVYDPVIQYPDASSTTKIGQAWAYDGASWQWTSVPQPDNVNYFPPAVVLSDTTTTSIIDILKPCADNQYRNPATNRCNTVATAAVTLTPCGAGEERNPDTNRCRKISAATTVATTVKDIATPTTSNTGWFVAALAALLAAAYGIYEWRQDIKLLTMRSRDWLLTLPERFRR